MIPIPRTRKGLTILVAILLVICIGITIFAFISWSTAQKKLDENGVVDFNALSIDQLEHDLIVHGTIDTAYDYYAETYETDFGVRTSDDSENLYYVVPIYDLDANNNANIKYFITFKGNPKQFNTMNQIMYQTWNDVSNVATLRIENGLMRNLPEEFQGYLTEWSQNPDFYYGGSFIDWCVEDNLFGTDDREMIQSKFVPYMIYESDTVESTSSAAWVCGGLSVALLILLLILKFGKAPIKGFQEPNNANEFRQLRNLE